ncbi:ATPase, T2SS/T4P/T4SS family, partial [Armatimonas sp.]|uniref:GspE/PulE family protein n=1 Tax=Armatimonas sp. TaxID=1872638 RepID=UPI00286D2761
MDAEPVVEEKEEWWSAREVTRFLSLSAREIEKLRRSGTLSATKRWPFGWRYSSQSVMGYFESLAVEAPPLLVQEPVSVEESARIRMQGIFELMKELEIEKSAEQEEPYSDYESAPPLIRVVNAVFANAIDGKASDVYFEAGLRSMRVRFRIGGVLQEVMPIPKLMQDQVTRRVMVMADIDLARLFVPQVGTINLRHNNRDWVVRVTAIPSIYGHTVTARFIDADLPRKGFRELGMLAEHFVPLENALEQEGGLFIFAGASASGTTTTVAACLHHLNKSQRAIYTIEQPVEYELPGITQIQLNPFCGHTLDKALKTVLRARPDVLFLGSIHDTESARAAM